MVATNRWFWFWALASIGSLTFWIGWSAAEHHYANPSWTVSQVLGLVMSITSLVAIPAVAFSGIIARMATVISDLSTLDDDGVDEEEGDEDDDDDDG